MLLSPEWCYSNTNSKDHFHEKVSNAVVHPTLPTPFKGEGEQQQQLQKYTGKGSAGYNQGCDFSGSTEKPIECIHHDNLSCCIHCYFVAVVGAAAFQSSFQAFMNSPVAKQQCHLVIGSCDCSSWLAMGKLEGNRVGDRNKYYKKKINCILVLEVTPCAWAIASIN